MPVNISSPMRCATVILGAALCAFTASACAIAAPNPYRWSDIERVVALSDPHGAIDALQKTLQHAGIVDVAGQWTGGTTHLVITGDLLDRGADSRRVMDLVMALEEQAPDSGGMVHLTLGNHEVMNLVGDLRYVARGEYAAFAAEESAEERERWFRIFAATRPDDDPATLRAEFDRDRPPGFYGHRRAFRSDGQYGKWLLSKPVMVVVNDTAFVHGGLSPLVGEHSLDSLNAEMNRQVREYVAAAEILAEAGVLDPAINFYDHASALESVTGTLPGELAGAADIVRDLSDSSIHRSDSPLWYRGTVGCGTLLEDDTLSAALSAVGARRVAIGHTPTYTRRVLTRHGGRVIEIDTGMLNSAYRGTGYALMIEGDSLGVVSEDSAVATAPVEHPRRVGARPDDLSVTELEAFLTTAGVSDRHEDASGQDIVSLSDGNRTISAIFVQNPRNRAYSPALTAYRLDRMLELDMIPVTVAREIDGRKGALQFLADDLATETARAESGRGGDAWCPLGRQWNAMYIYDALVYNQGRAPTSMLYSTDNWQLILSGNGNTFDSKRGKPRYLETAPLSFGPAWTNALESLTDARLNAELGDVLDERRLKALAARRELLLAEARAQ